MPILPQHTYFSENWRKLKFFGIITKVVDTEKPGSCGMDTHAAVV